MLGIFHQIWLGLFARRFEKGIGTSQLISGAVYAKYVASLISGAYRKMSGMCAGILAYVRC